MTPSETPIQPDYTTMSISGNEFDLRVLITALDDLHRDNIKIASVYPANFDRINASAARWRTIIEQAIKDAEFESSLNHLPFPEK